MKRSVNLLASVATAAILLATIAPSRADMLVTSANRYVTSRANLPGDGPHEQSATSTSAGSFNQIVSTFAGIPNTAIIQSGAGQVSTTPSVIGAIISGTGSAYADINFALLAPPGLSGDIQNPVTNLSPSSYFQTTFTLAAPHLYFMSGTLGEQVTPSPNSDGLFATSVAVLVDDTNSVNIFAIDGSGPVTPLSFSGILPAGDYKLIVATTVGSEQPLTMTESASGSFQFDFLVRATPEPASATLAGMGAVGLAGWYRVRWRKRR